MIFKYIFKSPRRIRFSRTKRAQLSSAQQHLLGRVISAKSQHNTVGSISNDNN